MSTLSRSRRRLSVWLTAALLSVAAPAAAHVSPSVDTNNRYLNVTPMADRVRFSYTVLIGETPGRMARHALDLDGDRTVSEAEANAWGQDLARRVQAALEVTIDGHVVPVVWSEVFVGMDDRGTDAGAFSLDLIAWLCAPTPGARREVDIVDHFALTPPGETEVRISDEPGVRVEVSRVGQNDLVGRVARFEATAAPLSDGLHLVYAVKDATPLADGRCPVAPKPTKATSRWPLVVGGIAALAIALLVALRLRPRS
jgi:hypothetical protein